MGSGKTTVGEVLARLLGWPLIDTDLEIGLRAGRSILQIFTRDGEAFFRKLEREVAEDLRNSGTAVIATGGGMLIDPRNREFLSEGSLLVHLRASPETLAKRLYGTTDRPLLAGGNAVELLREIYRQRADVYEDFPVQVETDGRPKEAVAQEILVQLFREEAPLHRGRFRVHHGLGAAQAVPDLAAGAGITSSLLVLVDRNVWRRSGSWLEEKVLSPLRSAFAVETQILPVTERKKSLAGAQRLWEVLHRQQAERTSGVVVVGGGVLTDLGAFAASTYKRGIRLMLVPTTLLAQIDAAIGGKTGVNFGGAKNQIGTFYLAQETVLDPLFLLTLPVREFRSGLAEMIKAAAVGDARFFAFLEENMSALLRRRLDVLQEAVRRAAEIKIRIVEDDFREESGRRMLLNFGHTLGHAFEALSRYRLRHGEAVAIGMALAARLGASLGRGDWEVSERLEALLRQAGLPTRPPEFPREQVLAKIAQDKKRRGGALNFVLLREIGSAEIVPVRPEEAVEAAL